MAKTAAALGNFDGIHLGHTAVLDKTLSACSDGLVPTAVLFREHTEKTLRGFAPPMLMTDGERRQFITDKGFRIAEVDFSAVCGLSPEEFVENILIKEINTAAVVCGYNYRFGKNASGDSALLKKLCEKNSVECHIVDKITVDGMDVSSTAIRGLIGNGEIKSANRMLGRFFGFSSTVFHGDGRGRKWGFPTVNQYLPEGYAMPKFGVYSSVVTVEGIQYKGVTNIGSRPTVGTQSVRSETYIFDFSGDAYGKTVRTELTDFIRPEIKFSSFDELKEQIKADIAVIKGSENDVYKL